MKTLLKKFHLGPNQSEDSEGSSKVYDKLNDGSTTERLSHSKSLHNPFSAISGWLNSVNNKTSLSPPSSSNVPKVERLETFDSIGSSSLDAALDGMMRDLESSNMKDPDTEEEFQIQLALELSAREDPEAVQIEAVKQISLGSCPSEKTPAEVASYRYWNYNSLSYDDKILDGFYDLYGTLVESTSSRIPSLIDLQRTQVSDDISWEAILVNKAADAKLSDLEQKAQEMALKLRLDSMSFVTCVMVQKLATLVSDHMGGSVSDPEKILIAWRNLSYSLKENNRSMVLPLGSLTIGLARHRALLFKVLADSLAIPCCLMKGQEFTGSDDVAMNIVKIDDGREYIVDLMADPGALIPSDAVGAPANHEDGSDLATSSQWIDRSLNEKSEFSATNKLSSFKDIDSIENKSISSADVAGKQMIEKPGTDWSKNLSVVKDMGQEVHSKANHPYTLARSPSWTEGISSPAVRRLKVKDVSELVINAAQENPHLAQRLHDVLLESGVVAPPNLFTEMDVEQLVVPMAGIKPTTQEKEKRVCDDLNETKGYDNLDRALIPPLHHIFFRSRSTLDKPLECSSGLTEVSGHHGPSEYDIEPSKCKNNVPVAAAAAAAAVAVASSMVIAAAKADGDPELKLPAVAALTATATAAAAAVVATTAINKQYEILESVIQSPDTPLAIFIPTACIKSNEDGDVAASDHGTGDRDHEAVESNAEGERISDRSADNESSNSDITLDDVAECEIPWEDISLGERIGLGSYGEVYRGDWHGTEVAVKKFLDQEITGETLEEFKSEVQIMKRLRHPNVVLFMGAITHPPNLSIVTEFLPRGSLYRLIHRPNNQLDERRRMRMALDVARGVNYLHNCTPAIVHRDLKSPNLLVDKNWVVKVCDFGLSRMKHNTYLSSRSTSGTAEWMAPEVLRNEPSNEKCDVYSFGVILWELFTLQQPWGGMNPMQVVGAVAFQHRSLDIPDNLDSGVADIIRQCWLTDPKLRPSFAEIMAALKPLQKPVKQKT